MLSKEWRFFSRYTAVTYTHYTITFVPRPALILDLWSQLGIYFVQNQK